LWNLKFVIKKALWGEGMKFVWRVLDLERVVKYMKQEQMHGRRRK
jgi:hypothetical protein